MKLQSTKSFWFRPIAAVGLCALFTFAVTACKSNPQAPIVNGTTADASQDAADGNLAPVDNSQPTQVLGTSAAYTPQQQSEYPEGQQAPAPIEQGYNNNAYPDTVSPDDNVQDAGAVQYADQAPPPLPEYDQPPAPEPDYLWTPGYWGYGDGGYYWVPGVWCPPPYYGALWTPPYWGYYGNHYRFHHGYWGLHVGYYGGIDYGFGYIGIGYFGGYWHDHDFYYNRSVTNVNFRTNVYERTVVYNNVTYGRGIQNRVSYNGGRGGINVAPRPAEIAAMRESHVAAVPAQHATVQAAMQNRGNFYNTNHGRPAEAAFQRPVGVTGPAHIAEAPPVVRQEQQRAVAIQQHNMAPQPNRTAVPEQRPGTPVQERGGAPAQPGNFQRGPEPLQPNRTITPGNPQRGPEPNRTAAPIERAPQPAVQNRPQPMAHPQSRPAPQAQQQFRPQPQAAPQNRPAPEARPAPQPQQQFHPQPAAQPRPAPEARPAPAPAPRPTVPAPAPRPAPAPAPRPAAPAPRPAPAPAPHAEPGHDEHR